MDRVDFYKLFRISSEICLISQLKFRGFWGPSRYRPVLLLNHFEKRSERLSGTHSTSLWRSGRFENRNRPLRCLNTTFSEPFARAIPGVWLQWYVQQVATHEYYCSPTLPSVIFHLFPCYVRIIITRSFIHTFPTVAQLCSSEYHRRSQFTQHSGAPIRAPYNQFLLSHEYEPFWVRLDLGKSSITLLPNAMGITLDLLPSTFTLNRDPNVTLVGRVCAHQYDDEITCHA